MRIARFALAVLALGLVSVAACAPTIEDNHFSCEPGVAGNCPDGFACIGGRCRSTAGGIDGGPTRDAGARDGSMPRSDAGPPDGGPTCMPACMATERCCGESCADVTNDAMNCGACGLRCAGSCVDSVCVCETDADCDDGNACTVQRCMAQECVVDSTTACECGVCNLATGVCDPVVVGTPCGDELTDDELSCEGTACDGMGNCLPTGACDGAPELRLDATPGVNCASTGAPCQPCGGGGEACCVSYAGRAARAGCMEATTDCAVLPICIGM